MNGRIRWHWIRHPILHFVLIGVALYAASLLWEPSAPKSPAQREAVVISAARIETMRTDFDRRWGTRPTPEQTSALIAQAVDEELLYREARLLALDFKDGSVRRRLIEKMRAVSDRPGRNPDELVREAHALGLDDDIVIRRLLAEKMRILLVQSPTEPPPTETDLQDYLDRHRDRFEQPAELTFSQIFLSKTAHGSTLEQEAQARLTQLRSGSPHLSDALEGSDSFLLGLLIHAYSKNRVTARFGKVFAERVFALQPGVWSDPIASPYGLHLVWVEEKTAPRLPELAAVRGQVVEGVQKERAARQLARGIERLRARYAIRVEGRPDLSSPAVAQTAPPES